MQGKYPELTHQKITDFKKAYSFEKEKRETLCIYFFEETFSIILKKGYYLFHLKKKNLGCRKKLFLHFENI